MLTVQLVKVFFKLLMATHPTYPLILFIYHLTRVCLNLSNEEYKLADDVYRIFKEFNVGEYVMVGINHERIQKTFSKKLYARAMSPYSIIRKLGSNAYLLICLMTWMLVLFSI